MKDQYTMIDNVYKEYKLDVTKNNQEYEREIDLYKHLNSTYDLFCFLHRPSQKDKITDLEKQIQINTEMIQNYVGSIEESSNERKRLLSKLSELQTQFEEQSKELTQYKQREQVIEKKEMEAIDSIKTQMSNSTVELALKEKGLNTVELYNKCISLQKQLDAEKYLRSNVELYISFERVHNWSIRSLSHVLHEIEEKAPQLIQQKKDYERSLESHNLISQKYESLMKYEPPLSLLCF